MYTIPVGRIFVFTMSDELSSQRITRSVSHSRSSSISSDKDNVPTEFGKNYKDKDNVPTFSEWSNLDQQSNAVLTIQSMLSALPTESPVERAIISAVNYLAEAHVKLLSEYKTLKNKVAGLSEQAGDSVIASNQALQYTRRDTLVVTGIPFTSGEDPEKLKGDLATQLSSSGVTVTDNDFSAYHRNGNKLIEKEIANKTGDGTRKIIIPPSVTVRFRNSNLKDRVIRGYKNFDSENKRPKKIRVFQSTTPYYSNLKKDISNFFRDDDTIKREIRWIHWRSPSCGMAVKCKDGSYFQGIHCMEDLLEQIKK